MVIFGGVKFTREEFEEALETLKGINLRLAMTLEGEAFFDNEGE